MRIPLIQGIIDRRILVNYTADATVVSKMLPYPFLPKLYNGKAIVGICLIRLKQVRPKGLPSFLGISSENGAHRIAVEWLDVNGKRNEGVFIPRRDTSSYFNTLVGGRVFPGKHFYAKFDVNERKDAYEVAFQSSDGTSVSVKGKLANELNENSVFDRLSSASSFFEKGAIGFSPNGNKFDGLKLETDKWEVKPLLVDAVFSSYFTNEANFPAGTVQFDHALIMRNVSHQWSSVSADLLC